MASQTELIRVFRSIPPKWALGIIALLIGYWLLQPVANRTFGWNLPTLVAIINNDYSANDKKPTVATEKKVGAPSKSSKAESKVAGKPTAKSSTSATDTTSDIPKDVNRQSSSPKTTPPKPTTSREKKSTDTQAGESDDQTANDGPTFGYLKSIGRDRYVSPEGLVYAPGSEEGHRLKHIERHTADIPNRPGSHGVFEGDMKAFLATIDKGYRMAMSKAKGTKTSEEDGMTVLEITFEKKIGFVGGSDGRKKGTPSTKRLRIIVNGDRLITAFPF
jgi:hypothetical protein